MVCESHCLILCLIYSLTVIQILTFQKNSHMRDKRFALHEFMQCSLPYHVHLAPKKSTPDRRQAFSPASINMFGPERYTQVLPPFSVIELSALSISIRARPFPVRKGRTSRPGVVSTNIESASESVHGSISLLTTPERKINELGLPHTPQNHASLPNACRS